MTVFVELLKMIKSFCILMMSGLFLLALFTFAGVLFVGCGPKANEPNVEIIQDMMDQPALKAQDYLPNHRDQGSMRVPAPGSWPKNVEPYLYWNDAAGAAANVKNPYASEKSAEFTQLGKRHYTNYCVYCHGENLDGNGPVAEKWKPIVVPSLVSDKVRKLSDGGIFHVITAGQGMMGTYIHQLSDEKDRWAVVNYIRSVQEGGK